MFSMYFVETRDQVILLGQMRVSTFSRDSGKSKKWGPSYLTIWSLLRPLLSAGLFLIFLSQPSVFLVEVHTSDFQVIDALQPGAKKA